MKDVNEKSSNPQTCSYDLPVCIVTPGKSIVCGRPPMYVLTSKLSMLAGTVACCCSIPSILSMALSSDISTDTFCHLSNCKGKGERSVAAPEPRLTWKCKYSSI